MTTYTGLLLNVSAAECEELGVLEPKFNWVPGQWVSGKLVRGAWLERESVSANGMNVTLNFTKIGFTVTQPVFYQSVTNLQNEVGLCVCVCLSKT